MWITIDNVAMYLDTFKENNWRLVRHFLTGWDLIDPTGRVREEFLEYQDFLDSMLLKTSMPQTYELIRQELMKDVKN
jgi:hypothetical protein